MSLTDPGYLFLLLPAAAAVYALFPARGRTVAVCLLSVALFVFLEPENAVWLLPSIFFDAAVSLCLDRLRGGSYLAKTLLLLAIVKDLSLLVVFGVLRPLMNAGAPPATLLVTHASALLALLLQKKGGVTISSPVLFCGYTLLAGRLPFGPIAEPSRVIESLKKPVFTFQRLGNGVFLLIFGAAKRVILAEQLFALYKTLLRLTSPQMSVGAAWLTALCPAMGIFFVFSAYSDLALGTASLFGVELPRMTYYPLQARGARESIYHLNMPLEDVIGRLVSPFFRREDGSAQSMLVSVLMPFALAVQLGLSGGTLLWALWLFAAAALDCLFSRPKKRFPVLLMRLATLVALLPAYVFLGATPSQNFFVLRAMIGLDGAPLLNDVLLYLLLSNGALLLVSAALSTNLISAFQRWLHRRFPAVWWLCSAAVSIPILAATASFMIRNVR